VDELDDGEDADEDVDELDDDEDDGELADEEELFSVDVVLDVPVG
jgi:hypothetical protein